MKYLGIISEGERYQDNLEYYQKKFDSLRESGCRNTSKVKGLIRDINFHKEIDHSKTHTRVIKHVVDVYQISNPSWAHSGRNTSVPSGSLIHLSKIDLGEILENNALIDNQNQNVTNAKKYLDIVFSGTKYFFDLPKLSFPGELLEFAVQTCVTIDDKFEALNEKEFAYPVFSEIGKWKKFRKWNFLRKEPADFLMSI